MTGKERKREKDKGGVGDGMRRNSGGAGPRCEEAEKGRGRETGAAERGESWREGSAEEDGTREAGRSAAPLSPGIAGSRRPARPRFKGRPGGRGRTHGLIWPDPELRELNQASAVGTRLSGRGTAVTSPCTCRPSPSCSPSGTETPGGSAWAAP